MESLQKRKSSSIKKPDVAITASSFYLKETLPTNSVITNSVITKNLSNSSVNGTPLDDGEGDEDEQSNLILIDLLQSTTKKETSDIPKRTSVTITNVDDLTSLSSNSLNKRNSILQRSLSFLSRSEEKKTHSQFKVHRYTIYDDEKDEFIEIVEEEWEGDGPPPPRKSINSQRKNVLLTIDKALPNLPEQLPEKENLLVKFKQWLKNRYPYINKYKLPIIISLIIFFVIILIIIILAATGNFGSRNNNLDSTDTNGSKNGNVSPDIGKPGLQMNGTGDGTYYDPGIGVGACGKLNTADEFVGAMNAQQFGENLNPNNAPICGMCVKITGPKGIVKVKIMDKCPICKFGDIDLSPAAFNVIGDESQGRILIRWEGC
ncbi:hypothetical protein RhiirA5_424233 [Rhizophagus irregularis]|uniref:RlpA-like protein double-psi beta-barrel domain-containing protein n=4 Tax=Rhizophagus irregularis TaxID=588596 RepID=A0A2I1F3Z2_9GLOM|nr:hypothetical protein RhiirA5_424233 [Rhizophagus irregularis]PKC58769.1 hypothetical protein RhiirA1_400421 [Rhizophagus irregularis]PKY29094.1 hypothetical protein RhiirB3_391549 [Rhizophagus irregularis]CAB4394453.1 unnamed protein product [Rhizophagus irregularis]CAB4475880.1 unnamed protein product [Rhizophagus irregularis]